MTLRQHIFFWSVFAVAAATLVWLLQDILLPFVLGGTVAFLLDPLVTRLERAGLGRTAGTSIVLGGFVVVIAAALAVLLPLLQGQLVTFVTVLPSYIDKIQAAVLPFVEKIFARIRGNVSPEMLQNGASDYAKTLFDWASNVFKGLLNGGGAIFNAFSILVVMPVVAFYMLRDWERFVANLGGWLPLHRAETIKGLAHEMNQTLAGFVRGQAVVCLSLGVIYGVLLTVIGVDFGFLIGLTAGALSFIPYVGGLTGFVAAAVVTWFQFENFIPHILMVCAVFGVGQFIEGAVLVPRLVGEKIGLHPVWVIFALMAGGSLMGFVGIMIAVPVAAMAGVLVRFAVARYLESPYYKGAA